MIYDGEGAAVLPEEVHEIPLAEDADNVACAFLGDEDAVGAAGEELDCGGEFGGFWQGNKWCFLGQ